ncbi:MAG: bifunctional DNA primase/polymerase [Candidatus Thiodiazotropha sp.]
MDKLNKYQKEMLNAALHYADRGWAVLPVSRSKKPINSNGSRGASTDKSQISAWWQEYPNAQIGITTGEVSGIWVVDVDMKNGKDGLKALQQRFGPQFELDEETLIQKTPTGGFHFIFAWDDARVVHNAQDALDGVDIRGDGGFIMVAPSSFNVDGEWIAYQWNDPSFQPLTAPSWAWELAASAEANRCNPVDLSSAISGISQGSRDNDLFRIACMLRSRDVSQDTATTFIEILAERCNPPFDLVEARAKVERAYNTYQNAKRESVLQKIRRRREMA